jgi:O-antigen/teichoic acid export membrane protein
LKITANAVWLVGCRVSADVLSLVLFITISRYFGPSGVGAYSYGFAIATFVYVIGSLGLDEYGVREYARLPADRRPALIADLLGTQAVMLTGAVVGLITYLFVTDASRVTMGIVGSLAAYQLASALTRTLFVPAIANQAMVGPAMAELGCRGGAIAVAVLALVVADSSLLVALSGFSVFALLLIIVGVGSAYRHGGTLAWSTSRRAVAGTVKVLWSFAAAEVMVQVFTRIGLVTLSLSFGEEAAGVYATGLKFVEIAWHSSHLPLYRGLPTPEPACRVRSARVYPNRDEPMAGHAAHEWGRVMGALFSCAGALGAAAGGPIHGDRARITSDDGAGAHASD